MDDLDDAPQWIKGILRAEMAKKGLTYADLALRLKVIGVEEDAKNLANKIGRGTFSAILFMQCLSAMGLKSLTFDSWMDFKSISFEEPNNLRQNERPMSIKLSNDVLDGTLTVENSKYYRK